MKQACSDGDDVQNIEAGRIGMYMSVGRCVVSALNVSSAVKVGEDL